MSLNRNTAITRRTLYFHPGSRNKLSFANSGFARNLHKLAKMGMWHEHMPFLQPTARGQSGPPCPSVSPCFPDVECQPWTLLRLVLNPGPRPTRRGCEPRCGKPALLVQGHVGENTGHGSLLPMLRALNGTKSKNGIADSRLVPFSRKK